MEKLTRITPKAKQRLRKLRKEMTEAEKLLWKALRNNQLNQYKFRRQHPYGKYILDFVCIEAKLVIEVDGGQHQENTMYDQIRSVWLEREGFKVLRFWNNEVLNNLGGVVHVIEQALHAEIQPHPGLPPARGKGNNGR